MTSGTDVSLRGVWGTSWSDVYAVGMGGTILHYDGISWSSMTSGTSEELEGVWGTASNDVYAVGRYGIIPGGARRVVLAEPSAPGRSGSQRANGAAE
jgi:hypothetical protein